MLDFMVYIKSVGYQRTAFHDAYRCLKVLEILIKIPATFLPILFISVDDIIHNAAVVYAIILAYKGLINSNDSMQ